MNCVPHQANKSGYTALMYSFIFGVQKSSNHHIFLKLLDLNCKPEKINNCGNTALIYAFWEYGKNYNCDSRVFLKMLNMNCMPEQANIWKHTALKYALKYYITNPNCNSSVFFKLIMLSYPSISYAKLTDLLDKNTNNYNLKKEILDKYNYEMRIVIINSRRSKRRLMGKRDSSMYF
jgi:hypothetical protein